MLLAIQLHRKQMASFPGFRTKLLKRSHRSLTAVALAVLCLTVVARSQQAISVAVNKSKAEKNETVEVTITGATEAVLIKPTVGAEPLELRKGEKPNTY